MNHDALIDAAARQMTQYDPSPDFRARAMSQLETPARRRWLPVIASVTTVAAGIAAVLIVWRQGAPATVAEPLATPAQVSASSERPADTNPLPVDAWPARPGATRDSGPGRLIAEEELAWQARALAPLPVMTPVTIEPIQPSVLSITPIVVTPLVTEPVTVPPIDPGAGGRSPSLEAPNSLISQFR